MTNYIIICDYCSWKIISNLENIKILELKNDSLSSKKYRCPNCGRAITPKKIKDPQKELEEKQEEQRIEKENEEWLKEHLKFQTNFLKEDEDE